MIFVSLLFFVSCKEDNVLYDYDDGFPDSDELGHFSALIDSSEWHPLKRNGNIFAPYAYSHKATFRNFIKRDGKYETEFAVPGEEYTGVVEINIFGYNDDADIDLDFTIVNVKESGLYSPSKYLYDNRISFGSKTTYDLVREESFINIEEIKIVPFNLGNQWEPRYCIDTSSYVKGTFRLIFKKDKEIKVENGMFYLKNKAYRFATGGFL